MHMLTRKLQLDEAIDRNLSLFKIHLPYHESDHVLNIAYNLLAGGTCLEHLELLRNDEAYLDALGARRIPDPTTAGDFCRRFGVGDISTLQETFNTTRLKVWRQQPAAFFEEAIIEGACKGRTESVAAGGRKTERPIPTLPSRRGPA